MLVTGTREFSLTYHLDPEPVEVGHVREQVRKTLPGWGLGEHTDIIELIVSELVTNAMVHGNGQIQVRLSYACGELRTEVHDDGGGRPARRKTSASDECGRGLTVIDGRGARRSSTSPPCPAGPVTVQRRVSQRGQIMIATQRIQVGMIHARKIVTVTASDHSFQLGIDGETVSIVPRTTSREIHRYKAYAAQRS